MDSFAPAPTNQQAEKHFSERLEDARTALRIMRSVELNASNDESINVDIPGSDLPVYRRGVAQLQDAIKRMTNSAYELEELAMGMPSEQERYYRISDAGAPLLRAIRSALDIGTGELSDLLGHADRYLAGCSELLTESDDWREV